MPLYTVQAYTPGEKAVRQSVQAASPTAARALLRNQGLFPVSVKEDRPLFGDPRQVKLTRGQLVQLFLHLEMQLGANIQVVEAVTSLKDALPTPALRYVLREVHDQLITSRANLTDALRLFPRSFPPDVLTVIQAGEDTATLPERFKELRERLEFVAEVRKAIISAVTYPAGLILVGCGMVTFFMGKLVPQLAQILKELNTPLPAYTLHAIAVSNVFKTWWLPALIALALTPVAYALARRSHRFALAADTVILRLPLIGSIYRMLSVALIARIYRSLALAGKHPLENLDLCSTLVSNLALRAAIRRMRRHIEYGATLAQAFKRDNVFPPEACAIVASGERGGLPTLATALHQISVFYSSEGRSRIAAMTTLIGPIAIVCLAVLIGSVLIAMFLPFFDLIKAIK